MGGSESDATSEQKIKNDTKIAVKKTIEHIQKCGGTIINDMSQQVIIASNNARVMDIVLEQNNILNQPNAFKCFQQTRTELEDTISTDQEADQEAVQTPTSSNPILGAAAQIGIPGIGGSMGIIGIIIIIFLIWYFLF